MSLPSGYTQLEYIESTGTQWIDTKVFPAETRILIDAFILEKNTGNDHHIASASWAETGKTELFNVMRLRADRTGYAVRYGNGNLRNIEHQGNVFGRHTFNRNFPASPYTAQVDSAETITLTPGIVGSIGTTLPLFAFRRNQGTPSGFINMRLYSCKIWKRIVSSGVASTDLVREFIPAKNSSGVIGLWDDVNSSFYTNSGTGTFIAGELPPATHKTLINGTLYDVKGGKCMVNGTVYNILKGRTLIDGTGWDITFPSALTMPVKGDLITMNLDGTDRQYRVLKIVDGTTVEVLGMWNVSTSTKFDNNGTSTYAGKTLDTYLNTTWYNTLSTIAKAAIVPKNINQYQYSSGSYNQTTHASYADYSTKSIKANVGNRYVYALDVEDIEMYFGGTGGSAIDKTPGTFSNTGVLQMFWNQTSTNSESPWFRSAVDSSSMSVWRVYGGVGVVSDRFANLSGIARPAFQIDLSKIDFTIN